MADRWYFGGDAQRFGPFTGAQLKEQGVLGKLQPTDTVWKEGVVRGMMAAKVKNLFPPLPVETLPDSATMPIAEDRASSLPPYSGLSSLTPDMASPTEYLLQQGQAGGHEATPAAIEPGFTSTNRHGTADEPLQEMIPDGLMLKGIPEQNDSRIPVSAVPIHSPGPNNMEGREPGISPVAPGVTDRKPTNAAYANHGRSSVQGDPPRKGRALAVKGAVISSQDGEFVHFRKKCDKCGYEDTSRTSMRIRTGVSRESFFCPKCRKVREVQIQGII